MIPLHFKIEDHWSSEFDLIWQNTKIAIESQGGDLPETTGLWFYMKKETGLLAPLTDEIINGINDMWLGCKEQLIPRVKAFKDTIPNSEPGRWVRLGGVWYRAKDMSHAQAWYIWAGLIMISLDGQARSSLAHVIASKFALGIIKNGFKVKWNGETTYSGNFFPPYPSNAYLRAMSMAKYHEKRIPLRCWFFYWTLPLWTWVLSKIKKKGEPRYGYTDAFNTCIILYFMGKRGKLRAHMKRWKSMKVMLEALYNGNTATNSDTIQNDCKWILTEIMSEYVS